MAHIKHSLSDQYDDVSILTLQGEITESSLGDIRTALEQLFAAQRPFVIAEISQASTIAGSVLGEIMEWRKSIQQELDGEICFAGISGQIEKQIRDLRGDKVFNLFLDIKSAVNYLFWEYKGHIETVILELPGSLLIVPPTRKLIQRMVLLRGYTAREAFQVETIVDELCNNAIEHGGGAGTVIEVALAIGRAKVEINVSNSLQKESTERPAKIIKIMEGFAQAPSTNIESCRGRGLALVKMLSDTFEIDSSEDGTCVHVTKYREGQKNADSN